MYTSVRVYAENNLHEQFFIAVTTYSACSSISLELCPREDRAIDKTEYLQIIRDNFC